MLGLVSGLSLATVYKFPQFYKWIKEDSILSFRPGVSGRPSNGLASVGEGIPNLVSSYSGRYSSRHGILQRYGIGSSVLHLRGGMLTVHFKLHVNGSYTF